MALFFKLLLSFILIITYIGCSSSSAKHHLNGLVDNTGEIIKIGSIKIPFFDSISCEFVDNEDCKSAEGDILENWLIIDSSNINRNNKTLTILKKDNNENIYEGSKLRPYKFAILLENGDSVTFFKEPKVGLLVKDGQKISYEIKDPSYYYGIVDSMYKMQRKHQ